MVAGHSDRGHLWRSRWAAIGAAVAVSVGAGGVVHWASAAESTRSSFVAITPVRVLDSRDGLDLGLAGPFVSPASQDLTIAGPIPLPGGPRTVVPVGATGVVLNVTAVGPTHAGFVSVRPADAPDAPGTSNLNVEAGTNVPNAVTVQVPTVGSDAGRIELTYDAYGTAGARTDLLVDVVGYYVAAGPPRTETMTIPWNEFFPGGAGGYAYAVSGGHVGRSLTGVGGNGGNRLSAPIMLPQGARITAASWGVRDNGAASPSVSIVRYSLGGGGGVLLGSVDVSGASSSFRAVGASIDPGLAVIDNSAYLYTAEMFLTGWTTGDYEVGWLTLTYTTP